MILKPDSGTFTLSLLNPFDKSVFTSGAISAKASIWDIYSAIRNFYLNTHGANIAVTLTSYDSTGAITTKEADIVKSVYVISALRQLPIPSTSQITVKLVTSKSTITVTLPKNFQLSSTPLSGNFRIRCHMPDGTKNDTTDISSKSNTYSIALAINAACPLYRDKYELTDGPTQAGYEDGRDMMIRFVGYNFDIPQWEIINSPSNPLIGNQVQFNSTTFLQWDPKTLFYEPLPYDFLYTNETSPQVIMNVDGVEVACHTLNCSYNYVVPTAKITSFSHSGNTLTIIG